VKSLLCIKFIFLLLSIAFPCFARPADLDKTITVDGRVRQYLIHLPASFGTSTKLPLLFAFHGGGSSYTKSIKFYGFDKLADENNFIVVYPNAIHKAWSMPGISSRVKNADDAVDDVKFISVLLDTLIANFKVDRKRVFCSGISRGGMFSFYLAYKLGDRITAIAPVCGGISQTLAAEYSFKRPMSVLMINGTADQIVSYSGGAGKLNKRNEENESAIMIPCEDLLAKIVKLNNCHSSPIVTSLPDKDPDDGCRAIDYLYVGDTVATEFIKEIGAGHTWPGGSQYLPKFIIGAVCRDFNASEKIFSFFLSVKSS
jgi:polyhydroxybutyrate depolymerase